MRRVFLLALVLGAASLLWVMPFCYYINVGWCADWTPIIFGIMAPLGWFAAGLVIFMVAWFLDKKSERRKARLLRWAPFVLMLASGVFFLTSETLRRCVIDAAEYGKSDKLKMCLRLGGNPNSLRSKKGPTALWIAVSKRHMDVIDSLLARGASATSGTPCGMYDPIRALRQYSTRSVDEEIRQKLIKAGAQRCPD